MEELNPFQKKMNNTKLKLSDLNPHLMCVLCGGYYIDATTIIECLHSFCRSCIVKYLERNKYCPICEVQVHKTKPLINIRPDKTLQNIVYKLVPGLFSSEMRNRRKFYKGQPQNLKPADPESVGEVSDDRKIYINDEHITFSLVYRLGSMSTTSLENDFREIAPPSQFQNDKRYFKCPTGVTVNHLKKLLKAKYDLNENNYKVEVYFGDQMLHEEYTLLDISYMYLWKTKGNLDLTFKIFENIVKRQKIEEKENGRNEIFKQDKVREAKVNSFLRESQQKIQEIKNDKIQIAENINGEKEIVANDKKEIKTTTPMPSLTETKVINMDVVDNQKPESCQVKENGMSVNDTKEVQLQISESGIMSVSQVEDGAIVRTMEDSVLKVVNSQIITNECSNKSAKGNCETQKPETINRSVPEPQKKPPAKPVKPYKTIRCSPKTWHPVIPKEKLRPTLIKNSDEPKKPLKFFKMRNMPRFLGNPSSGVKPMYGETPETTLEDKKPQDKKVETTKNKILKIDPKTLRPIEKEEIKVTQTTPNVPNLLTNPFIPNNNHFLFSDLRLLPPNAGNYSTSKMEQKLDKSGTGGFKCPVPNGTYPPICFPSPEHSPGFHPFTNLKPHSFPFPITSKMDPLFRASRLSPFGNLTEFNVAGFHASLPPSISRLLNPHHHFRKISQSLEKKNKDESTKETNRVCDDSIKINKTKEEDKKEKKSNEDNQGGSGGENTRKNECREEKEIEDKVTDETTNSNNSGEKKKENVEEKKCERKAEENSESASQRTDTKAEPVTNNDNVKAIDKEKER